MPSKTTRVPRNTDNPIEYLISKGVSYPQLSVDWGLGTTDNVRKLRAFKHVPSYGTAVLMAQSFGWSSGGEVMDFWAVRVAARKAS